MFYGFVVVHHGRAAVLVPVRVAGEGLDGARSTGSAACSSWASASAPILQVRRDAVSAPSASACMLLFGGRSAEHDVSRVTAVAVAAALDPEQVRGRAGRDHDRRARGCSPTTAQRMLDRGARDALPAAFDGRGLAARAAGDRSCRPVASGDARRRRRVPAAARTVRRGRHGAGPARAGRAAVRRRGRARLRGRHGQGR